jgi:hypothetical protein
VPLGLIDNWLCNIQDIQELYRPELDALGDEASILDRLWELNVLNQTQDIWRTTVMQNAFERGQKVVIHAWIHQLSDGQLQGLASEFERRADAPAHGLWSGTIEECARPQPQQSSFERPTRGLMTRAFGSPNTPRAVLGGGNSGKAYASRSRRCRFAELAIRKSSRFRATQETPFFTRTKLDLSPQMIHTTS